MEKRDYPVTPGIRFLREKKVPFTPFTYSYEDHGGTARAASFLEVPEHAVIKTLVMESDSRQIFLVLMHGDREVSTRQLARQIGARHVSPCDVSVAQKQTGYLVGGISPFGTRKNLPVYVQKTIFDLERVYINAGKRGFLVEIDPLELRRILPVAEVDASVEG
ncbi:MAG: aminoacyl-tRNA deacylase [Syntrophobacteraceae bacterium]|nr:aminoacyl-tRNA deacylase [Desulfobacteraceae bacterium]